MTAQETECRRALEMWADKKEAYEKWIYVNYDSLGGKKTLQEAFYAGWNTIGKELAEAMEDACIELERARDTSLSVTQAYHRLQAALTKYRGTK